MSNVVVPPPGTPVPIPSGPNPSGTPTANWQNDILSALGAPITGNNQGNLNAWNACEGNNPLPNGSGIPINNPFNTTLGGFGGVNFGNSAGVKNYPNWDQGLAATVATITKTAAFAPIWAALKANAPRSIFAAAVGASGWGTGGACIASASGKVAAGAVFPGDKVGVGTPDGGGTQGDLGAADPGLNIPVASWVGALGTILSVLTTAKFWIRVGYGILGFALIVTGLTFMLSESDTAQSVAKTATSAALEA